VWGLPADKFLEAVDLGLPERVVDVGFSDRRTALLLRESTGLVQRVDRFPCIPMLAGGQRRRLRDDALLE
jgi:hypothetical protein